MGLPIEWGRDNRPNLVVNTPLVLKGRAATWERIVFRDTVNTISRTAGDKNGDSVTVTTTFFRPVGSPLITSDPEVTQRLVLKDGQRKRVNLPGRGTIFVGIPR